MPGESFKNLEDQYFMLDKNFNRLFEACDGKDGLRNQLRRDYVTSRDNFWEARLRIFVENDPLVKTINKDLTATNATIKGMLSSLKKISEVLDTINAGVKLGSSLITTGSTGKTS